MIAICVLGHKYNFSIICNFSFFISKRFLKEKLPKNSKINVQNQKITHILTLFTIEKLYHFFMMSVSDY